MYSLFVFFLVSTDELDYTSMDETRSLDQEHIKKLLANASNIHIGKTDLKIMLFNKNVNGTEVDLSNATSIEQSGYTKSKTTVFIIHGWMDSYQSPMAQTVKDAYLASSDLNIFVVDWSKLSKKEYLAARISVIYVGRVLSSLISGMVRNNLLNLENVVMVGHSLGAHIAGCAGKNLNGKTNIIVGKILNCPLLFKLSFLFAQ